ncbi:unnamed protein product [Ixodes hexagonus]
MQYAWFDERARTSLLYTLDPHLHFPKDTDLPRFLDTLLHRLQLNIAFTRKFLNKISRAPSPDCTCGMAIEDVEHLPFKCTRFSKERQRLEQRRRVMDSRPLTLSKILGPWPSPKHQKRALHAIRDFFVETDIAKNY